MKKQLTIQQADQLIEAYYEGSTTTFQELLLRDFLAQEDLPKRFDAERAIFGYFVREKYSNSENYHETIEFVEKPKGLHLKMIPALKWTLAAAVVLSAVLLLPKTLNTNNVNVAYVNGVRLTDKEAIKSLALASIQNMELDKDEVETSLQVLNESNLIEMQLENFPSL